jgi:hypothetical protein
LLRQACAALCCETAATAAEAPRCLQSTGTVVQLGQSSMLVCCRTRTTAASQARMLPSVQCYKPIPQYNATNQQQASTHLDVFHTNAFSEYISFCNCRTFL